MDGKANYLEPCYQGFVASFQSSGFPVLVNFYSERPRMIVKVIIHGALDVIIRKNRRTVYSSIWLLYLGRLFEAVHDLLELILGALCGGILLLVHGGEKSEIFFVHIIWTAGAILYGGRKANVCRWLGVREGVELVILQRASNSIRSGNVYLSDLTTDDGWL